MAALALEIEHGVDHVLEHARAGDRAVLGDVADQQHGDAAALGERDQFLRRGADLGDGARARCRACRATWSGSNSITDDLGRVGPLQGRQDVAHARSRRPARPARRRGPGAAARSRTWSMRFFARDVGAGRVLACQRGRDLQQQGRLADAGIAADQQRRARHQAAAAHAIELGDAARARRLRCGACQGRRIRGDGLCRRAPSHHRPGPARAPFLDDGVPLAAGLAATAPFVRDRTAGLADEALQRARHGQSFRTCIRIGPSARPWMNWSTWRCRSGRCRRPAPARSILPS